jgi:hypothetical protein
MAFPVAKVLPHHFARFLRDSKDVATLWNVDDNRQFTESMGGSYTVDELMDAISMLAGDCEHIYVYNANVDDPDKAWDQTDYGALPEVTAEDLKEYVVRSSMGKDFLYFACSPEEGSSDRRITLLPGGFEDEEGGDR